MSAVRTIRVQGPTLYPKQHEAIFSPARHVFIEASTKAGKTVGCLTWQAHRVCADPGEHWWVAPVNAQAKIAFKRAKKYLPREIVSHIAASPGDRRIELINGSVWGFKSADNPDSLYGEDVRSAVVDEASRCREEAWTAIRSTLTATRGPTRAIGNVKGRKNWFYRLCRKAQSGGLDEYAYYKLTAWDAVAGGVLQAAEILAAKEMLPEDVFRELYLAEPTDDGWNPFGIKNIDASIREGLAPGEPIVWGIDLAKSVDWTVLVGLNEDGDVCEFERWQKKSWKTQIALIRAMVGEVEALVDSTGIGDPILEELRDDERDNFDGFRFTAQSKQQLMEGLAVDIGRQDSRFPEGELASELRDFEYEHTRTGVRYSAPEGLHDDCVCAFALARAKYRNRTEIVWWK